jgi:hypothetical protein
MGEHRRRLALPKQRRVGVARQPVKVSLLIDPRTAIKPPDRGAALDQPDQHI